MNEPENTTLKRSGLARWSSPRRWPFWVVLLLLAYTLGGFFGVPWLLERTATRQVAELGRTLSFGEIKVNPFLLTLQMKDTEMHDTDGALLFSYDDYFFNLQASSLFRWAWTFREIRLDGLQVNWERFAPDDDRLGRLIDSFPKPEETEPEPEPQGLPRLVIQQLRINDAGLLVTDHLEHGIFDISLGPINVEANNLSTLPDQSGQQQVQIATQSGGVIAWQGNLQLSPLHSEGTVTVEGRLLSDLDHYLALVSSAKLTGEGLEWSFSYQVDQAADQSLSASIDELQASFTGWKLFLPDAAEPLVAVPHFQVTGASLHWPQQTLDIGAIEMRQAELNLVALEDGSLNLDRLLAEFAEDETATDTTASPGNSDDWQVGIRKFSIQQAALNYSDTSTDPAATVGVQDISVVVSDISNQPGASLPVQATFALASGGSGQFDGQAVVLPEFTASGRLGLDAVQLQVAQPWVNDLARITLNSGNLKLDGEVMLGPDQPGSFQGSVAISEMDIKDNLHQEKLVGWQQLVIDQVEVDLTANTVKTSELQLQQPFGRLQIAKDQTTNLDGLMIEDPEENSVGESSVAAEAAAEAEAEAAPPMAITVAGFKITEASLDFSDLS
ncbi:MAG TPA: DUF748 domain-containing protein, partial [Xanthomonadales bacterium]|nr:DUF748 domain-containing protein [Xanthomonadales bacterium]